MAAKTTGAEWKQFYADKDAWPEGAWHDDEEITIDGAVADDDVDLAAVPDTAIMRVSGGVVFLKEFDSEGPTLEAHFKRWRRNRSVLVMAVECPREQWEAVTKAIREAGGRVLA